MKSTTSGSIVYQREVGAEREQLLFRQVQTFPCIVKWANLKLESGHSAETER